jgi:hypothetical protein
LAATVGRMKYALPKCTLGTWPGMGCIQWIQSISQATGRPSGKTTGSATRSQSQLVHVDAWPNRSAANTR